jgi:hypothetical protein
MGPAKKSYPVATNGGPIAQVYCHRHLLGALKLQAKASFSLGSWHRCSCDVTWSISCSCAVKITTLKYLPRWDSPWTSICFNLKPEDNSINKLSFSQNSFCNWNGRFWQQCVSEIVAFVFWHNVSVLMYWLFYGERQVTVLPWRRKQQFPPKRRLIEIHVATFNKTAVLGVLLFLCTHLTWFRKYTWYNRLCMR